MKWKKTSMLLLAALLILTAIPIQPGVQANATYFNFSNSGINNSTTANPHIHSSSTIDLQGTFTSVRSDSMKVTVEQIYEKGSGTYEVVAGQTYTRDLQAASGSQFQVKGITLFEGLNRITLSGSQGSSTVSDDFYILYDSSPYLTDLKIRTAVDDAAALNAGVGTVVRSPDAYLEGKAPNATEVIINGTYSVQPINDGTFFSPVITLKPGKNTIKLKIVGSNSEFEIVRTVYYYDGLNLMYEGSMYFDYDGDGDVDEHSNESQLVIGHNVTFAVPFGDINHKVKGKFSGRMMVPAKSTNDFNASDHITLSTVDGDSSHIDSITIDTLNPIPIRSGASNSIEYYSYKVDIEVDIPATSSINRTHSVRIETQYRGTSGIDTFTFTFADNTQNIIENVLYIPQYDTQPTEKIALDSAEINASSIYIEVDLNQDYPAGHDFTNPANAFDLEVYLSPFDPNNTLVVEGISVDAVNRDKAIYKISNIPTGSHTLVMNMVATPDVYDYLADVIYVAGARAIFTNLFDGMIMKYADLPSNLKLIVRSVDSSFDKSTDAKLWINSKPIANAFTNYSNAGEEFSIVVPNGTFEYGENVIRLELVSNGVTSVKEIRILVTDDNLPAVNQFKPVLPPSSGARPVLSSASDRDRMYKDMTGMTFLNDVYYMTAKKYDLVIEAARFEKVLLQYSGETLIDFDIDDYPTCTDWENCFPTQTETVSQAGLSNKTIDVDYDTTGKILRFRIRDIVFETAGSQVFYMKITNQTGSQASQRLEVVRELVPFSVLSPVPTTNNKIIVSKNFVKVKIQAEGADQVLIGKETAKKLDSSVCDDCFELEYLDLKPNKDNAIDFTVIRGENEIEGEISVYYALTNVSGAQFKEEMKSKHKVFDSNLQLSFPKGALLKEKSPSGSYTRLYEDQRILFGLANPQNGVVETVTDEGVSKTPWYFVSERFKAFNEHFTFISPVYWISGGLGEKGTPGASGYEAKMDGVNPHQTDLQMTYTYTDPTRHLVPTKRGELTIKYDDIVRDSAGTTVGVFYFDSSGNWVNMGGIIDTKKHEITVPFDEFGYYVVARLRYAYSDIDNHPWASRVLEAMYSKGFMNAARFDEFGPDDNITRGEFAQLLVRALQLELNYDDRSTFLDVQPGSRFGNLWEYKYIETAARAGIVQGIQSRVFGANQPLTREQASLMISKALELKLETNDDKLLSGLKKEFADASTVSFYARPAVMAVFDEEIMTGRLNRSTNANGVTSETYSFAPLANLTRAEAASVAVRIMQDQLKYFPKNLN
ncbi:S-layer homology domain-containing protein [Marinicrinis sediminis]|uniref:S-layer homology domain-containing protein n=1 Tax=Marinicrinis sediminis TaxID=1652465 RepID=A0ABW5RAU1_9BACL